MNKPHLANKFQMHYYFGDDSHTMDALVRNRCEAEVIAILTEIAKTLDESILIECEAHREGGLRDIWQLANANAGVLSVIVGQRRAAARVRQRLPPPRGTGRPRAAGRGLAFHLPLSRVDLLR